MSEGKLAAILSVTSTSSSQIENLAKEKELVDILHKKLGYSYQKKYITYNRSSNITIFTVYGPNQGEKTISQKRFRKIMSLVAEHFGQRFVAFINYGKSAEIDTSDLGSIIEYLDERESNWIVPRYSAWMLGEPFSKMNVSSVQFVSKQEVRPNIFRRIGSFFSRRKYVKRFKK